MAGDTRSSVVLFVSLLLLSSLPLLSGAETGDVLFEVQDNTSSKQWYAAGDVFELTTMFSNDGPQTSIENDPSCGVVLQVFDDLGALLLDESSSCRGQSQSIDLAEGETYIFDALSWNLQLADGAYVEPGIYTVSAYHSATQSIASSAIQVQTPVNVSSDLALILELNTRLNQVQQNEEIILGVSLHNPTNQVITLPSNEGCFVHLNVNGDTTLQMPCFAGFESLQSYEQTWLGHILFEDAALFEGDNTIEASLPSGLLLSSMTFTLDNSESIDTTLQRVISTEIIGQETEKLIYAAVSYTHIRAHET